MQFNFLLNIQSRLKSHTLQVQPSPGERTTCQKNLTWNNSGGKKKSAIPQQISLHSEILTWLQCIIKISEKPPSLFSSSFGCNSKRAESWPTACTVLKCHSHPQDRDSVTYQQCAGLLERDEFHPSRSPFRTRDRDASYLCWH